MTDDWSLNMDDWWMITDDWWLMIDDWWLMSDEWWLTIDDKMNTNIIWNGPHIVCPRGGPPLGKSISYISYYICIYFIINHQSSLITHQSSVINHQSSIISYQSSIIHDQWSIISHQLLVINFVPTHCEQFCADTLWSVLSWHACNVWATGWEPSDIIEDPREGLESVGSTR